MCYSFQLLATHRWCSCSTQKQLDSAVDFIRSSKTFLEPEKMKAENEKLKAETDSLKEQKTELATAFEQVKGDLEQAKTAEVCCHLPLGRLRLFCQQH
jgi:FtsZ-binding cell division protein ZapB